MRLRLSAVAVLTVTTGGPWALFAQQVVLNHRGDGVIDRAAVVSASQLTRQFAEEMSRGLIETSNGEFRILRFAIGTDERDVLRQVGGKGRMHVSYDSGKAIYERELKLEPTRPLAETIAIGNSAVLRWRGPGNEFRRVVLAGKDPLWIRAAGSLFEIVHFASSPMRPELRDPPNEKYLVDYYLRTRNKLDRRTAEVVTRALIERVGLRQIGVHIAHDLWFVEDPLFPSLYRFEPLGPFPTPEEYRLRLSAYCGNFKGEIRCRGRYR